MTKEELLKQLMSMFPSGCSVTQRIKQVKQPRGGYINPKEFSLTKMGDGIESLFPEENVPAGLVGLSVDYMTRFMSGAQPKEAFKISLMGAHKIKEDKNALRLLDEIRDFDNRSIINAIKLSGYDVCYRAGEMGYKPVDEINPDDATISNVITMIERSLNFLNDYGPKVLDGFTFDGAYTDIISSGDGDFTTENTLWDFKVTKRPIRKEHTLQLLIYWRMGLHSIHPEFKKIKFLGIYNPRKNEVLRLDVSNIPQNLIVEIEKEVIGY